jgi:DNA-binding SARP family transcriptional activator
MSSSSAAAAPAPRNRFWQITLLGGLSARQEAIGPEKVLTRFRAHKYGALLAFLAHHLPHPQSREVLTATFWPEMDEKAARNNLSVALSSLRAQLEPPGTAQGTVLRADRHHIGLNPGAVVTDVQQFEAADSGSAEARSGAQRREALTRAVRLYRGKLLRVSTRNGLSASRSACPGSSSTP